MFLAGVEGEKRETDWKDLGSILKRLPLEKCELERHQVTGELGWHAPRGLTFRITGRFVVFVDSSADYFDNPVPQKSAEIIRAENSPRYQQFLERNKGDTQKAMESLLDWINAFGGEDTAPEAFNGKWLVISPDIDGTIAEDVERRSRKVEGGLDTPSRGSNFRPNVYVKMEVQPWYDRPYLGIVKNDIVPGPEALFYDSPIVEVFWRQYYAEAELGFSKVELTECPEPEEDRRIITPEPIKSRIEIPFQTTGGTSDSYCEFIEGMTGRKLDAQERAEIIRYHRRGLPFSDDPLRHFRFPTAHPGPKIELPEEVRKRNRQRTDFLRYAAYLRSLPEDRSSKIKPCQNGTGL